MKWMWSFKQVSFTLEETKNSARTDSKDIQSIPFYRNKSAEMYNNFGHITSLSG